MGETGCISARIKRSVCRPWIVHVLPFPIKCISSYSPSSRRRNTILKVFSSSLICWASMGVRRLHVAISPLRSYSPLGHVSWNCMRGLKLMLRAPMLRGVPGILLESPLANLANERK